MGDIYLYFGGGFDNEFEWDVLRSVRIDFSCRGSMGTLQSTHERSISAHETELTVPPNAEHRRSR